jgi:hypothetical protein
MEGGERITIQGGTQMRADKATRELRARSWFASLASDHLLSYMSHIKDNATHISLYDDHATGINRNSKLASGHMHRHQLTYDGIRPITEMEMMHLSALGLLDNMYHVGDCTKDGYNGAAHDIYQLQRSKNAMWLFFPESFYPINEAFAKSADEKASKLRKANTIFPGKPSNEIAIENIALYPPMETGQGSCKTQSEKYSEWNTWPPIGTLFSSS